MTELAKLVQELVAQHGPQLVADLTARAGLDALQAGKFVPAAGDTIAKALAGGGVDISRVVGGDFGALLSKIDVAALAKKVGIDGGRAQGALATLLPLVLQLVRQESGGLEGLLKNLAGGGGLRDLGGAAAKLFGKD